MHCTRKTRAFIPLLAVIFIAAFATIASASVKRSDKWVSDSITVQALIQRGRAIETTTPDMAGRYYHQAYNYARIKGYTKGMIIAIHNITFIQNLLGQYDSSLIMNTRAVKLSRQINDSVNLAKALFNTGTSLRCLTRYDEAAACYHEGSEVFLKLGDESMWTEAYDILQVLYYDMHQYAKAIEYGEKALSEVKKGTDHYLQGRVMSNLGVSYVMLGNYERGRELFNGALMQSRFTGDKVLQTVQFLNLGDLAMREKKWELFYAFLQKALPLSIETAATENELIVRKGLLIYYMYKHDYNLAEKYGMQALSLARKNIYHVQRQKIYSQLSNLYFARQDVSFGMKYSTMAEALADSLLNESILQKADELEKKFGGEKSAAQVKLLLAEKRYQQIALRHRNILMLVMALSLAGVVFTAFLMYKNFRHRRKIQLQRIAELESEKLLAASEAVIKGEEQERSRLARDLHDGLGGMLSGIRHSFGSIRENLMMTDENMTAFERSMDMLDTSISEMRRVAHNMMPESLLKFGLDATLSDFCRQIGKSGAVQITYQSIGDKEKKTGETLMVTIYRIVQELINNIVRHSGATKAIVQLNYTESHILITVEDNGCGFDTSKLSQSPGIGWSNIKSRIDFLKGSLDIHSGENKGTSIYIEIKRT